MSELFSLLLTIFHLSNISNNNVSYRYLNDLTTPDDRELLFLFNSTLQTPKLLLLTPVIESRHQYHTYYWQEDCSSFNPTSFTFTFFLSNRNFSTNYLERKKMLIKKDSELMAIACNKLIMSFIYLVNFTHNSKHLTVLKALCNNKNVYYVNVKFPASEGSQPQDREAL